MRIRYVICQCSTEINTFPNTAKCYFPTDIKNQGKNNYSKAEMTAPQNLDQDGGPELETKNKLIELLSNKNTELQELQANIM